MLWGFKTSVLTGEMVTVGSTKRYNKEDQRVRQHRNSPLGLKFSHSKAELANRF